ncbi:hypothetical protein KW830_18815, partial [Comamonas sp. CMM03]|uniref:hypothetical protein n=1 Tax=Comamonas sp. CMM03 TaxID=2854781 RepID=UPI001C46538F
IPNRTVKRICADDSAGSRVKVGHRQALTAQHPQLSQEAGGFVFGGAEMHVAQPRPLHYSIHRLLSADRQPHKKEHAARALFY